MATSYIVIKKKSNFQVAGGTTLEIDISTYFAILITDGSTYYEGANVIVTNCSINNSTPQLYPSHTMGAVTCYATKHVNSTSYADDIANGHPNTYVEDLDTTFRSTSIDWYVRCAEMVEMGVPALPANIVLRYVPAVHPPNLGVSRITRVLKNASTSFFGEYRDAQINTNSPLKPDRVASYRADEIIGYAPNYEAEEVVSNVVLAASTSNDAGNVRTKEWIWYNFGSTSYTVTMKKNGSAVSTFASNGRICQCSCTYPLSAASSSTMSFEFSTGEVKTSNVNIPAPAVSRYTLVSSTTNYSNTGEVTTCTAVINTTSDYSLGIVAAISYKRTDDGASLITETITNISAARVGTTSTFNIVFDASPFVKSVTVTLSDVNGLVIGAFYSTNTKPFVPPQ